MSGEELIHPLAERDGCNNHDPENDLRAAILRFAFLRPCSRKESDEISPTTHRIASALKPDSRFMSMFSGLPMHPIELSARVTTSAFLLPQE